MSDNVPFTDAELLAYTDGALDSAAAAAIEKLPAALARAHMLADETARLSAQMFRVTCPDTHTLGEYQQNLLTASAAATVAAHTDTCPHCQAELADLKAFMEQAAFPKQAAPAAAGAGAKLRVLVARLIEGGGAANPFGGLAPAAGLRGAATDMLIYEADDGTQINLEVQADPNRPGRRLIVGLVLTAAEVDWQAVAAGAETSATVDVAASGDFELAGLPPGEYQLTLTGGDTQIVLYQLMI